MGTSSYKDLILFVWKFIRPRRIVFFLIFLVSFVWALDATLWPYLIRLVIDILTVNDLSRSFAWEALKAPALYGVLLWVGVEWGFRLQGFLQAKAFPNLEADIRMEMFDHIQRHSPRYFNEHFAGSLANKITDMVTHITLILQNILTLVIPAIASFVLAILFFAPINPLFAGILGGWIVIHFAICIAFSRKCDLSQRVHGEARSSLLGKVVDSFTNNFAVNLFHRFTYERGFVGKFQKEEAAKQIKAKMLIEWMRVVLGLFGVVIGIGIQALMLYLWIRGSLSTGEVAQIFNTTWNIITIMWITSSEIPSLLQSIGIAKQAFSVMRDPKDILDVPNAVPLVVKQGKIIFEDVSFCYGSRKLFQNKNVTISEGEKVGLVGYSGGGKSTFVNLILRFYPIERGRILIDGQDISKVTLESLRNQITLIPQEPMLFHRTLEENIRYGKINASMKEVMKAAKLANCDEFILRCPKGYDTLVGERGTKLSGGERQRIAIARAILANTPILILDEATSALDSVTEACIQESFSTLMENTTTLVIAHRLSTLARMDRVLVFDQGRIVEEGTHEELLQAEGHYANMWNMQAGGFLPSLDDDEEEEEDEGEEIIFD